MRFAALPQEIIDALREWRWDRIIEKHEGPWDWQWQIDHGDCEFIEHEGISLLLPLDAERRAHVEILRFLPSAGGSSITLFLKDLTGFGKWFSAENEMFYAGYLAVCDRFPGQDFYVAVVYHEWFMIEHPQPSAHNK